MHGVEHLDNQNPEKSCLLSFGRRCLGARRSEEPYSGQSISPGQAVIRCLHVSNPDAILWYRERLASGAERDGGADFINLMKDPEFERALRYEIFYRLNFDEPFQFRRRSVMFGYRPRTVAGRPSNEFMILRFPEELARTLRFRRVRASEDNLQATRTAPGASAGALTRAALDLCRSIGALLPDVVDPDNPSAKAETLVARSAFDRDLSTP